MKSGYYFSESYGSLQIWYPPVKDKQSFELYWPGLKGGWESYTFKIGDINISETYEYLGDL